MSVFGRVLLFVLLSTSCFTTVASEYQKQAEQAFLQYTEFMKKQDTLAMAKMMHPAALMRFRKVFDDAFAGPKSEQAQKELLPLLNVADLSEFNKLSDVDAFKRLNEYSFKAAADAIEMIKGAEIEVLSSSKKGDVIYVIYNMTLVINGKSVSTEIVQKLREQDSKYLLLLPARSAASMANIEARYH